MADWAPRRDTIGGLLMLFGLLIVMMGIWEAIFADGGRAWQTMLTGGVIIVAGYFVVTGGRGTTTPSATASADAPSEIQTAGAQPAMAAAENLSGPTAKRFTIIQTGDDDVLDQVTPILEADARITSVIEEGGRWYSTPDRDDLPEWFALRVYCMTDDLDQFMEEIEREIVTRLGKKAANKVQIRHY